VNDAGLPDLKWIPFHDAEQWLACGTAYSLNRTWRDEEELSLLPLVEKCQVEMQESGRCYPFEPGKIGGNATSIIATLDAHRADWPQSGEALFDAAAAAATARVEKEDKLQEVYRRMIASWLAGNLTLYGQRADHAARGSEIIDPIVGRPGVDSGTIEVEIRLVRDRSVDRSDMFLRPMSSPLGVRGIVARTRPQENPHEAQHALVRHPPGDPDHETVVELWEVDIHDMPPAKLVYRDIVIERSVLIDWATGSRVAETGAGKQKATVLKKHAQHAQEVARKAIASGIPTEMTDKEIHRAIEEWCEAQRPRLSPPSIKSIRRAMGKS
jgi:hypothetical protein